MSDYQPTEADVRTAMLNRGFTEAQVSALLRELKAKAWDEGHSWGWSDAQDAHDVRQEMSRQDWPLCTPNPYRGGQ